MWWSPGKADTQKFRMVQAFDSISLASCGFFLMVTRWLQQLFFTALALLSLRERWKRNTPHPLGSYFFYFIRVEKFLPDIPLIEFLLGYGAHGRVILPFLMVREDWCLASSSHLLRGAHGWLEGNKGEEWLPSHHSAMSAVGSNGDCWFRQGRAKVQRWHMTPRSWLSGWMCRSQNSKVPVTARSQRWCVDLENIPQQVKNYLTYIVARKREIHG